MQNAYGYGLFTGGLGALYGAEGLGSTVIPIAGGNTDRQIMVMKDFGVTAICCTPRYFPHLIERAAQLDVDIRELPHRAPQRRHADHPRSERVSVAGGGRASRSRRHAPGNLQRQIGALKELNERIADTQRFGILRMIVSDWERAKALLEAAGSVVKVTEVLAVGVPDRPGGLADVLAVFEGTTINIEYMYAFPFMRGEKTVLIFRFDQPDAAIARLQEKGVNVLDRGVVENGQRL